MAKSCAIKIYRHHSMPCTSVATNIYKTALSVLLHSSCMVGSYLCEAVHRGQRAVDTLSMIEQAWLNPWDQHERACHNTITTRLANPVPVGQTARHGLASRQHSSLLSLVQFARPAFTLHGMNKCVEQSLAVQTVILTSISSLFMVGMSQWHYYAAVLDLCELPKTVHCHSVLHQRQRGQTTCLLQRWRDMLEVCWQMSSVG